MIESRAITANLLAKARPAILAVNRAEHAPHLTVVWFHWDGEAFLISTLKDRAKVGHIRRDPRVTLLVNDPEGNWYLTAHGCAELLGSGNRELTQNLFAKYVPGNDPTAASRDVNRVVIRIRPERIVTHHE
jgi:PPOX class probable F420-dependent enzyme